MRASSEKYRVILPSAADSEPLVDRRIGPAFSTRFQSIDRARGTLTQLLGIVDHLRRALARFKSATGRTRCGELGTHFWIWVACSLELGCESLYLFLLLRDHCFQLLNFANFAIEYGGALRWHAGRATTLRCATLHGALPPWLGPKSQPRWSSARSRVTTTTLPPTGWKLLKIPPM